MAASGQRPPNELEDPGRVRTPTGVADRRAHGLLGVANGSRQIRRPQQIEVVLRVADRGIPGATEAEPSQRPAGAARLVDAYREDHEPIDVRDQAHRESAQGRREPPPLPDRDGDYHASPADPGPGSPRKSTADGGGDRPSHEHGRRPERSLHDRTVLGDDPFDRTEPPREAPKFGMLPPGDQQRGEPQRAGLSERGPGRPGHSSARPHQRPVEVGGEGGERPRNGRTNPRSRRGRARGSRSPRQGPGAGRRHCTGAGTTPDSYGLSPAGSRDPRARRPVPFEDLDVAGR